MNAALREPLLGGDVAAGAAGWVGPYQGVPCNLKCSVKQGSDIR